MVEEYIKNELMQVLETWKTNGIEIDQEDFYGEFYVFSPGTFKFSIGDRLQIRKMVDYVKMKYDENGVQFSGAHEFQPHTSKKSRSKHEKGKSTRFFGGISMKNPATTSRYTDITENDQKYALIDKIAKIYRKHDIDSHLIGKVNVELIQIQTDAEGKVRAIFNCPLCGSSNKENRFVIHTKQNKMESSSQKVYWVLSNYTAHVQTHLKNSVKFESKFALYPSAENNSVTEMIRKENLEHTIDESNELDNHDVIVEYLVDEDDDEQIVDNSIEIVEISTPQTLTSSSELSYDDLESLIYNQITSQLNEVHQVSITNREIEKKMNFLVDGVVCTMTVNTTKPDGACFFRACDHQLNKNKLNSRQHTLGTNKLRKDVVEYIKQNRAMFDAELRGSVYGWYESMGKSTKNIKKFRQVCDDFLRNELPKEKFWAGSESCKAIMLDKSVNILVLVNNDKCYFLNGFNENLTKTVILAFCTYSNGTQTATEQTNQVLNHYDSVVHIEPGDVFLLSKHLATVAASRNQPNPAAIDRSQSPHNANET